MVGPTPPSSSSSWKTATPAQQAKYNLVQLPDDFEPTPQEEGLLAMYETVRAYEKEAARIKEQAAKEKLAAADRKYKQTMAESTSAARASEADTQAKKKRTRKRKKKRDDTQLAVNDQEEEESSSEEEEEDVFDRREAKLAEMREELEEVKQTEEEQEKAKEEALRNQLLAVNEEADIGPALKRKKQEPVQEKSSLIANLSSQQTPPHDFSKKLGLKSWAGKVLFPTSPDVAQWSPPSDASHPNEGAKLIELEDFNAAQAAKGKGNNTIAIKFTAPTESNRFSLNIAGPAHGDFFDVLFHFNPRHHERGGQVVVNEKQEGIWGQAIAIPLSQLPLIFGQEACTLVIQINAEGFDVFLEGKHCARLEHRAQLPEKGPLFLQFPSTDDYGSPENWSIYKVWWGNKSMMASGDLSGVAGVNAFNALHPRKLFVSGLSRISTEAEVDLRRAELERAFRKYGGDRGVTVTVPTNTTFAFVEVETERQCDLALTEMEGQYRLNRARRSRYEALQEERAAAEASKQGQAKESTEWD